MTKECVLCNLEYKEALIEKFIYYHICYKCVLQLRKKVDIIFSEAKDYEGHEAVKRSLSFTGKEGDNVPEYVIMLTCQKFPLKDSSIKLLC
jgi:hypothetical protein